MDVSYQLTVWPERKSLLSLPTVRNFYTSHLNVQAWSAVVFPEYFPGSLRFVLILFEGKSVTAHPIPFHVLCLSRRVIFLVVSRSTCLFVEFYIVNASPFTN